MEITTAGQLRKAIQSLSSEQKEKFIFNVALFMFEDDNGTLNLEKEVGGSDCVAFVTDRLSTLCLTPEVCV